MSGECSIHERDANVYNMLSGNPKEKTPLWRPRHRQKDNTSIKMDLWKTSEHNNEPPSSIKSGEFLTN
jgi:hypothetical protein